MTYDESINKVEEMTEELENRGWTLSATSRDLGVSRKTAHRWKSGSRPPQHPMLVALALGHLLQRPIPNRKVYKRNPSIPRD